MSSEQLTFYIIYIPGTVHLLSWLVASLLQHTPYRFNLVSNGCDPDESAQLMRICRQDERLNYISIENAKPLGHGEALNVLQEQCSDRYFCFMDSDIFATGDVSTPIAAALQENCAIFSGVPFWRSLTQCVLTHETRMISGYFMHDRQGAVLGSSYFAVYDNLQISTMRAIFPIGFKKANWEDLPAALRSFLTSVGLRYRRYDTAKAFNQWLTMHGCASAYLALPHLHHIGAVSSLLELPPPKRPLERWVQHLPAESWRRIILQGLKITRKMRRQALPWSSAWQLWRFRVNQELVSLFFRDLLLAVANERVLPSVPRLLPPTVRHRLHVATADIIAIKQGYVGR